MKFNPKYEKELNLKDLFFHILYHWRGILLITIVTAILFGGFQLLWNKQYGDSEAKKYAEKLEQYNNDKEKYEENIKKQELLLKRIEEYRNESLYMNLDPIQSYVSKARYQVRVDKDYLDSLPAGNVTDPADLVLPLYEYIMEQEWDEEELIEAFGTANMAFVKELFYVATDYPSKQIVATAYGPTREAAEKGRKFLEKHIENYVTQSSQQTIPHQLVKISEGTVEDRSRDFLNNINEYNDEYYKYKEALERAKKDLEELPTVRNNAVQIKDRVLLGAVIGFVLSFFIFAGSYMLSGKLHSGRDLSRQFNIPIYGEMNQSRAKTTGKGIDHLIEKWEFGSNKKTDESVYENICALLEGKHSVNMLLLVSTLSRETGEVIQKTLQSRLPERKILLSCDFLNNGSAVHDVQDSDAVLVLEKKNESQNSDLRRLANMLSLCEANVIGSIVL